jgi:multiple sugar transport system permease protein
MVNANAHKNSASLDRRSWGAAIGRIFDKYDRYIFPAPAVIIVFAMLFYPVAYTLYLSFHSWSGGVQPPIFLGFENYARMLTEDRFWGGLGRTIYFVSLSIALQLLLGILCALIFHRGFFGRGVTRTFFMFPMIATPAAMALVWKMMLDPTIGSLGYIVKRLGGPLLTWTTDARLVIPTLAMVDTWQWTPLVMIIVLAGLAALPQEPYEAAKVDGANAIQTFFYLTLPLVRPVLLVAAMFRMIDAIKTFDIIMIITGGGPSYASEILNVYAFHESLSYLHFGYGSTLLVALTVIVIIVAAAFTYARRREETF